MQWINNKTGELVGQEVSQRYDDISTQDWRKWENEPMGTFWKKAFLVDSTCKSP